MQQYYIVGGNSALQERADRRITMYTLKAHVYLADSWVTLGRYKTLRAVCADIEGYEDEYDRFEIVPS